MEPQSEPPESEVGSARVEPPATAHAGSWRARLLVLIVAVAAYALSGVWSHPLLYPDESRVAGIASETLDGEGSVWVPTLHGEPFLDKPPLAFWSTAVMLKCFGRSDAVARFGSLGFGLLGALFLGLLARELYGDWTASVCGVVLLLFTLEYYWASHRCLVDPPLGAFTLASVYFLVRAVHEPQQLRWFLGAGIAATGGFYSKGLLGFGFPAFALLGLLAYRRDLSLLKNPRLYAAAGLACLLILPWIYGLVTELGASGPYKVFVVNHLYRFLPGMGGDDYVGGHQQPFYYYVERVVPALLPGIVLLPFALRWHHRAEPGSRAKEALALGAGWFGLGFLLLTLAGTKRTLYLFPILPVCALLVGGWLAAVVREPLERTGRVALWAAVVAVVVGALVSAPVFWLAAETPPGPGMLALVLVGLALGGGALAALRAQRAARALLLVGLAGTLIAATNIDSWMWALHRDTDLTPFFEEVRERVPPDATLVAGSAHYSTLGSLAFTSERRCLMLDLEQGRALVNASAEPAYLVYVERRSSRGDWDPEALAGWTEQGNAVLFEMERGRFRASLLANRAAVSR